MAEPTLAPWLQEPQPDSPAVAPWLAEGPSVAADVAKAVPVGTAKGVIGLAGLPGDFQNIVQATAPTGWFDRAADGLANAFPKLHKFLKEETAKTMAVPFNRALSESGDIPGQHKLLSSADIKQGVESVTGKFPEAKTGVGKATQTGFEVLPSLMFGGGPIRSLLAKAAGAGVVSEGAGEAASSLKGRLPDAAQPWAEPVARGVGAIVGAGLPSLARRAVTPLPATPEQASIVSALRAKDPAFPMSAGQATNTPGLLALEARAPKMASMPAKQEDAFTRGTMKEMGVDGLASPTNIARGKAIGDEIGSMRRGAEISPTEFPALNREVNTIAKKYAGTVGQTDAALIKDIQQSIRMGASNSAAVASMPGARYDYMRQKLQTAIDKAGTGTESKALSDIRQSLDDAFHRSIPTDQSTRLKELETQYANYNVLKNKTPTQSDTVTPNEVSKAVAKSFGNAAVNENRGTLAPWARNAEHVMQEFPKPRAEGGGPASRIAGAILGGAGGGAAGHLMGLPATPEAIVGAILGGERAGDVVSLLKNLTGRLAATSPAQKYLGNQAWLPGQSSTMDRETAVRLLMSPPVQQSQ